MWESVAVVCNLDTMLWKTNVHLDFENGAKESLEICNEIVILKMLKLTSPADSFDAPTI